MDPLLLSQIRHIQKKGNATITSSSASVGASSYATRLSVTGRGRLFAVVINSLTATNACTVRITIDGGTPSEILTGTDFGTSSPYYWADGSNGKTALLDVPFASSLLIEVRNLHTSSQTVTSTITYLLS